MKIFIHNKENNTIMNW